MTEQETMKLKAAAYELAAQVGAEKAATTLREIAETLSVETKPKPGMPPYTETEAIYAIDYD